MKRETKDKLLIAAVVGAYVFLPWSALAIVAGAGIYYARRVFVPDTTGDDFSHLVLGAPVSLPVLPFLLLKEKLAARRCERNQRRLQEAIAWMVSELRRCGIRAEDHGGGHVNMLRVDVAPERVYLFQDVVAEATQRFSDLSPLNLYGYMEPREPLNQVWAKRHNLTVYATEELADPCVDCGTRDSLGYHFVDGSLPDVSSSQSHHQLRVEYRYQDGRVREVSGQLCRACQKVLSCVPASISISVRLPDTWND